MNLLPCLIAAAEETALEWRRLPPAWLLIMVILPLAAGLVWWIYRREGPGATRAGKLVLAGLRFAAILFILLLLFEPYAETSVKQQVKSHLVVLVDSSASMEFADAYSDPAVVEKLTGAAGLAGGENPSSIGRLELVKKVLANPARGILPGLAEDFHLHVYSFDADARLLASSAEPGAEAESADRFAKRLAELPASGAFTRIGDAIAAVLEEFRYRDEELAGIVLITDGRQNGGGDGPIEAARRAGTGSPPVPLYVIGVGDPDVPRNIHVSNLKAREVVLRGDDVAFDFTVSHKGFAGRPVAATLEVLDGERNVVDELDLRGADVILGAEDVEQSVHVSHRFERSGYYTLRLGIPVEKGEKIESDNHLVHHLQVVDKKIKVLYVDNGPRWEYRFLADSLTRDVDTILAHVINLDADPDVIMPHTPGFENRQKFPRTKEELFEYDVVIFGDVDWRKLADSPEEAREVLANLKLFVEDGGGFIMIAGEQDSPRSYRNTPVADFLPVILSRRDEAVLSGDAATAFNLKLTEDGAKNPVMMLADDPAVAKRIWEEEPFSAQFWYHPVEKAKTTAAVLAVHPGEFNRNDFGQHVLVALMPFKKGTSLYIGVEELWRLRFCFGNRFFYRFYGEAIRLLATQRLLGGNKRFKIFTDRDVYFVGDAVEISARVYDRDFEPSEAETQTVTVEAPDGSQREIVLSRDPDEAGAFAQMITVHDEGTWRITAESPDSAEDRPEKLFKVEFATAERKNPLADREALTGMAAESGGRFAPLHEAADLAGAIPPRTATISIEVRSEDLWDDWWVLFVFTGLLAAEWMLRKRWRLI